MCLFVVSATFILILVGLRIVPGRYDMIWIYILVPPALALSAALFRYLTREDDAA